jgi:hypothetical protein
MTSKVRSKEEQTVVNETQYPDPQRQPQEIEEGPVPQIEGLLEVSNQRLLREYEITIRFLNRGCIINVGCKSIPFESTDSAIKELNDYLRDPRKSSKKWHAVLD